MAFINKLDRTGADFDRVLDRSRERLNAAVVPLQIPIGREENFQGMVDLVEMQAFTYSDELGLKLETGEIPPELMPQAEAARESMLEALSDRDDHLMEIFLGGGDVPAEEIKAAIRRLTVADKIVPVICGSALKNKGI